MRSEILFIYNANTDPISAAVDYAHKVFKPSTYKCELCALTHHNLGQRSAWKKFKQKTDYSLSFVYIKGFEENHKERFEYPVVLRVLEKGFEVLLDKQKLSELSDVNELIAQLEMIK